ncbi:MAG: magnesium/cobalt transporter CorA [Planctomycetaceae bacterium]
MLASAIQFPGRLRQRLRRRSKPGAVPGTILPGPTATAPVVRLTRYGTSEYHDETIEDLDSIPPRLNQSPVTWVDVDGLGDARVTTRIGEIFGLHPLALEDVTNVHQRPKVEMYGSYLFLVARAYRSGESLESEQISMFLGSNFVVTFQESGTDCFAAVRKRLEASTGRIRQCGADYLLYSLLDGVIDHYFPVLEQYGERLDALDERIAVRQERFMIHQIHTLRSELLSVRRSIWPLREAVNALIRDSGQLVSDETDIYLRDCYDHTVQIIDVIETDRETCADLRDFYLTVVGNRMNEIMKVLTVIATLFMPLSFIAGLYGMNFDTNVSPWNMPELRWALGYPFALALMAGTALGLLAYFWKRGWLS